MALKTTAVARQGLSNDHVNIPTDANASMDTATEELRFLYGPCRDVISRTVGVARKQNLPSGITNVYC
jgi:hypothetical protein